MARKSETKPAKALTTAEAAQTLALGAFGFAVGCTLVLVGGIFISIGIGGAIFSSGIILILYRREITSAVYQRKFTRHLVLPAIVAVAVPAITILLANKDAILAWTTTQKTTAAPAIIETKSAHIKFERFDLAAETPRISADRPIVMNYFFSNVGDDIARKALSKGILYVTNEPTSIDSTLLSNFRSSFINRYLLNYRSFGFDLDAGDGRYNSATLPKIDKQEYDDLRKNKARLMLLTGVIWITNNGSLNYKFECTWGNQIPKDGNIRNASWHPCS